MKTREASLCILSTRHLTDDPVDMKHGLSHFFRATRNSRDKMLVSLHSPPLPSHIATHPLERNPGTRGTKYPIVAGVHGAWLAIDTSKSPETRFLAKWVVPTAMNAENAKNIKERIGSYILRIGAPCYKNYYRCVRPIKIWHKCASNHIKSHYSSRDYQIGQI